MTNISIDTETQTIAWQGFFGEVEGNLTLEDSTGNQFFNWTGFDSGTVLASRDSNVDFSNISPQNDCTIDEGLTGTRSDRVNNTFTSSSNTPFTIGTTTIAAGTACALNSYVNSAAQALNFEEIILTDDGGTTSIYATRIDKDTTGFDSSTHDFQLLVPDNRNESISTYYVYVELE